MTLYRILPYVTHRAPHRALYQGGECLSHQAGKGKANFQEPGLGNFQEGKMILENQAGSSSFLWIIY